MYSLDRSKFASFKSLAPNTFSSIISSDATTQQNMFKTTLSTFITGDLKGDFKTYADNFSAYYAFAEKYITNYNTVHNQQISTTKPYEEVVSGLYDILDPDLYIPISDGEIKTFRNMFCILSFIWKNITSSYDSLRSRMSDTFVNNLASGADNIGDYQMAIDEKTLERNMYTNEFINQLRGLRYITAPVAYAYGYWISQEIMSIDVQNDFLKSFLKTVMDILRALPPYTGHPAHKNHFMRLDNDHHKWLTRKISEKSVGDNSTYSDIARSFLEKSGVKADKYRKSLSGMRGLNPFNRLYTGADGKWSSEVPKNFVNNQEL